MDWPSSSRCSRNSRFPRGITFRRSLRVVVLAALLVGSAAAWAEDVETVVITAPRDDADSDPGTIVVSADQARLRGARTVAEAIASAPGVSLQATGSSFEPVFLRIRGSTSEQVLVLRDGRPITDSYSGSTDLARIPLETVERIEIVRGPVNAIYGGGAAGAINIITTPITSDGGWTGTGRYSFGNLGEHRIGTDTQFAGERLDLGLSASGAIANNRYEYQRAGASESRTNAGGSEGAISIVADTGRSAAPLTGDVVVRIESSERGAPGSIEFPTTAAKLDDERLSAAMGAEYSVRALLFRVAVDGARIKRSFSDPDYPLGALRSDAELYSGGAEAVAEYSTEVWQTTLRIDGRYSSLDDRELGARERIATALSPSFSIGRSLRLSTYGRFEYTDEEALPSARTTLSWSPISLLRIGAVGAIGYRLPTFLELFQPVSAFVVGNPDLDPELSSSVEGELLVGGTGEHTLRTAAYIVRYEDLIQWIAGPDGRWSPRNTGTALVRGVEIQGTTTLPWQIGQWSHQIEIDGEILEAIDTTRGATDGAQLPYRPRATVGGAFSLAHRFGHSITLQTEYVGARPVNAQNTEWLEPYLAIDLSARVRIPAGVVDEWFILARVDNILDEPYVATRFYPNPGREVIIGTEIRW